jgi:hypothetical protein
MGATRLILVLGGIVLTGCGGRDSGEKAGTGEAGGGTAGMKMDSGGMGGHMGMEGMSMMPMMRAHMDSMMRMPPAQMSQMMAMHERMMSQMMDRMGGDMRDMKMAGNAEWTALADSVKRDLADLPGLERTDLSARMRSHGDRVRRLLTMHEDMMKSM